MRTLNQVAIVQDTNVKYPFGSTVKNETETNEGTPIVAEYMGDIIQNIYKLLSLAAITPTGTEDSNVTQYQIVEALKKLPNLLNDVEQVLTLTGTVWSVPLNLSILPNKYFILAKVGENYISDITYTFKGTGVTEYPFVSSGFVSGDELLIIFNTSGVVAYNLTNLSSSSQEVSTTLGLPLAFNSSNKMWYQDNGKLFSDIPNIYDLQSIIRTNVSDTTVIVNDMFIMDESVVCFCFIPTGNNYFFRRFLLSDLTVSNAVTLVGTSFATASNFNPYVFADRRYLLVTNNMNTNSDNFNVTRLNYSVVASTLTLVSSVNLNNTFEKTTNTVIFGANIYTMVSGVLNRFNLTTGVKTVIATLPSVAGQIFGFDASIYFSSGEVAKKWTF